MEWRSVKNDPPKQGGVYYASNTEDFAVVSYWPHINPKWAKLDTGEPFKAIGWHEVPAPPKEDL